MIGILALFVLTGLLLLLGRSSQRFTRRVLAEGHHAHVVVRELRRETMRYYAYVDYFGPDGASTRRRVEYPRKEKEDLSFQNGQVVEVVDYRQRLYWLTQLQQGGTVWVVLAAGSLLWALVRLYTALA